MHQTWRGRERQRAPGNAAPRKTEPAHVGQAAPPRRADAARLRSLGLGLRKPQRNPAPHVPPAWAPKPRDPGLRTPLARRDEPAGGRAQPEPGAPGRAPLHNQMFTIQLGLAEGGQFLGDSPPGVCQPDFQPDSNSNFMTSVKDANENWHGMPGKVEPILMGSSPESPSDNTAFQAPGLPEGEVRSPPEGAEIPRAELEKIGNVSTVCSPLEDNGYASSSLSIDSPSSSPEPACGTSQGPGPPDPLLPSVAHAVQQLQAQERYKEREKEKHHVHLVMYRRLALLQWIRGLQHQLVDQQARLQESFDTILDNRKELIRCFQQGAAPSRPQDQD